MSHVSDTPLSEPTANNPSLCAKNLPRCVNRWAPDLTCYLTHVWSLVNPSEGGCGSVKQNRARRAAVCGVGSRGSGELAVKCALGSAILVLRTRILLYSLMPVSPRVLQVVFPDGLMGFDSDG